MTKTYEQLINNITGQLNGIKNMMEGKRQCTDVIIQLKAVKSSVNSLSTKYINESLMDCFSSLPKKEQDRVKKMLTEIINLT
ncbi:metal-sensitive transcriptional regulator [Candidatus Peregrinibacteria bacterium]|nr:metal-sensitive transcriptional regulator [Candidatus Peregrinibacteria bacterium]